MAESFLTLMAEYDTAAQLRLNGRYNALQNAGFTGTQTQNLTSMEACTANCPAISRIF